MRKAILIVHSLLLIVLLSCKNEKRYDSNQVVEFKSVYEPKNISSVQLGMSEVELENEAKSLQILESVVNRNSVINYGTSDFFSNLGIDSIGHNEKVSLFVDNITSLKNLSSLEKNSKLDGHLKSDDFFKDSTFDVIKGARFAKNSCWQDRPKLITDLTDGVLVDAYSFKKGDERKLGLLGFLNVSLSKNQKVIVVEYSQEGTQYCNNQKYKFGVGARLMMKVTASKRNAKLNTPQQITASVIFDRAEVTYSLKTFGITGPGVGRLNKTGTLSEDTYQEFIQEISRLIVDMYKKDNTFIVVPQPLVLKST